MFDFDAIVDRRGTGSAKWSRYPADVLPMWVADMDLPAPPCVGEALRARLEHPVFGYAAADEGLREQLVCELAATHDWKISPDDIVFLPGVEPGFNMALKAFLKPGDAVAVQTPAYPPLLSAPGHWGMRRLDLPFATGPDGEPAMDLEQVARGLARCQALLLCNPHNPTGRVLTRAELEHIAQVCLEHDVLIVSDEIHCDLVFDGRRHIPIASLSETVARRTITLMAASKTYNVAGLKAAFAVIADPDLRQRFNASRLGMVDSVNALGLVATGAAYRHGGAWKAAVLAYLQDNRDYLFDAVQRRLPGVSMAKPQATFLAWLDCSGLGLNDPQAFFLEHAKVGLNPGTDFGPGGAQHVRLNFGCPRATLEEGLNRLEQSLARRAA